ncbi:hypothetical protein AXK58_21120 [Tsukamurella tyrosinosolvens]|nr:hypothetical protein AXK58_21120 [Tsukamurella tyrosinosolvens]
MVVYFPGAHLIAEAVGPFRTEARAEEVRTRLETVADERFEQRGAAHAQPQVVRLQTLDDALEVLATNYLK